MQHALPGFNPLPNGFQVKSLAIDKKSQSQLLASVQAIWAEAPCEPTQVRSGYQASARMTNCGRVGWWSDRQGYRYTTTNPKSGKPWPLMPELFIETLKTVLAKTSAAGFQPDACLINHYENRAKMGLHQDKDEADFSYPIVTVCLGAAADFLIGGLKRSDKPHTVLVESGDVIIMGGESRMRFHGIRKIYPGTSPIAGLDGRISLTFRRAL